jgi:hypothetical protein
MTQTTQLNEYTKEEIYILSDWAHKKGLFSLANKLSDDYISLLEMEKEKEE